MKCNIASDAFGPTQDDSVALYDTLYERYSKSPMQDALRRGQPLHLSITRQGHRSSMVVNPTVEADPDAASWIQQNNLFVTPAYRRPGASSGEAKLLGLGAFPSGALISVTNLDMQRHQMSGHTVEQRVRGKTGSAELTLPAPTSAPGCTYQMTVTLLPDQMAVTLLPGGPKKVMSFTLPNPLRAEVQRRGVDYHPMTGLIDELKDGT